MTRELDLDSDRFTENTRAAYPLDFIGNADPTGMAGQPDERRPPHRRRVRRPAADQPADRATRPQYHFISGYTAKLAGTEVGVKEPEATFSACFGAPFMPRHPGEYAAMLGRAARTQHGVRVWLVNTGWTGGPYGTGERMNIDHTRSMVRAALVGRARRRRVRDRPGLRGRGPDRAARTSRARSSGRAATWADGEAYDRQAAALARMFVENFAAYADGVSDAVRAAGPRVDGEGRALQQAGPGEG